MTHHPEVIVVVNNTSVENSQIALILVSEACLDTTWVSRDELNAPKIRDWATRSNAIDWLVPAKVHTVTPRYNDTRYSDDSVITTSYLVPILSTWWCIVTDYH